MSDIFISYTSEDRAKAECLANALEQQGWSVWWDRTIPAGKTFDVIIEEAIDAAKCVVVLWSNISVTSRWVRTEAEEGARRNILVPVLIEEVKIPLAFRRIQAADLIGWGGDTAETNFDKFVSDISEILGSPPVIAAEERRKAEEEAQRKAEEKNARLAQAEAKRKAEEERKRAEEEAHRKAEEEKANQAQADAKRKAERLAEEEKRKHVEDAERGRQGSAEQRKVKEEAAKREAAFEAKSRADEEERQKAEKQRHADLREKQKAEEAQRSVEEDATRISKEIPSSQTKYLVPGIVGIVIVIIAGAYMMNRPGSPGLSPEMVRVGNFAIGKYEVTQGQWKAIMGNNPSEFDKGDEYPVEQVSFNDVQDFIRQLNEKTGKRYRLPTEEEWYRACHEGGAEQTYCGGEDIDELGWYEGNSGGSTHPVGRKRSNGLGIHDMSGNVWEWTNSGKSDRRVFRGGSWHGDPVYLRSAYRNWNAPVYRGDDLGFRLAQDL